MSPSLSGVRANVCRSLFPTLDPKLAMSRSDFDFSHDDDAPRLRARRVREQPPLVEITGADVWTAIKSGVGMAFYIGIAAGVVAALTGDDSETSADGRYLSTLVLCVVALPLVWVPLALAARATSRRKDFLAGLLRFFATLFVVAYVLCGIAVVGMVLLVRLSKLGG